MKILSQHALRGPHPWARCTALMMIVGLDDPEELQWSSASVEAIVRQLCPRIERPLSASSGQLTMAHALERVTLGLQQQAGCPVSYATTIDAGEPGRYRVIVEHSEEAVGREAGDAAVHLLQAARRGAQLDVAATVSRLRALDEDVRLGPSTGAIVRAAQRRGIPVRRLNEESLVQLGWGVRQRRILASETDHTSSIAESIAQDKELTKSLLQAVGVPVPAGALVATAEQAWAAARALGLPVVIKPQFGSQGRGVAVNLSTRDQVTAAFVAASQHGSTLMLVERLVPGADYRLLVVDGRVVAAARRDPPHVVGDGTSTIEQLVAQVNADPRRGADHATVLTKIRLDTIALAVLAEQHLEPRSIPRAGQLVALRRNANLSTGGSAVDVTDHVHVDVAAHAVDAARVIGLDVAGVDVVCRDIGRPLHDQGGVIVEVNAAPGLRMHLQPSSGTPRAVGEAIVEMMFPRCGSAGVDTARIPLVAVTGTNGKTTTSRLIAHLLQTEGKRVGLTCTDGIYVEERRIEEGDCAGPKSARAVLFHPRVDAAVLETARGGILREGLGFDRCDVAVVTNIGAGDHLGLDGIATVEQLAAIKRVVVENVVSTGTAVLNAADALTAAMARACPGSVIYFARDPRHPRLLQCCAEGERVVFVEGEAIVAGQFRSLVEVTRLAHVPLTRGGQISFQVENVLAAVAATWALGLSWDTIRAGLATFGNDAIRTPGRFNVLEASGATIIVDYGHNADAVQALVGAIAHMPHQRRLAVFSCAGDRRDADILRQAQLVGDAFDDVILYEDQCNRGRLAGEIITLMRRGLARGSRVASVTAVHGEHKAMELALRRLRSGDLVWLQVDQIEETIRHVERLTARLLPQAVALRPTPSALRALR